MCFLHRLLKALTLIKNAPLPAMCPSEAVFCLVGNLGLIFLSLLLVCGFRWVANDVFSHDGLPSPLGSDDIALRQY